MSLLKSIRKRLGRIKCVVRDQWPYRAAVRRMPEVRQALMGKLQALPPLEPTDHPVQFELHMLCGHRDADMGRWASWSIMRFMNGQAHLYVHSDGTLTDEDETAWRSLVGNLTVIDRQLSDRTVAAALKETTQHLYDWRCSNWASAQLVDVHFFGQAPVLLILDSDVLTFSQPTEVMNALQAASPCFRWCRDLLPAYSADPEVLKEVTGSPLIPEKLCAGFLVTPRLSQQDFLRLDDQMEKLNVDGRMDLTHFWSCQTYYALVAAGFDGSAPLSASYDNTWDSTPTRQILRHYVGVPRVRFRYFEEGIPRVLKSSVSITPLDNREMKVPADSL